MNRKATAKASRELSKREQEVIALSKLKENSIHPYDDLNNWLKGDFKTPPWTPAEIADFQKRLDSAFGAPNAIVLAWSGDRRYGDVFLNENGDIERKPPLLFKEIPVNDRDYIYMGCPRWLLMEVLHGSQLEASWEEASTVEHHGVKTHIRPEKPPEFMYQHLKIIADHDDTVVFGDIPPCCEKMFAMNSICYGKYALPSEKEIAYVRTIRENMDKAGVVQRNDAERSKKVLMDGAASTRHFIEKAKQQQAQRVKDIMLANSEAFFGNIPELIGTTKTHKELEHIYKGALDAQDEDRFQ